MLRLVVLVLNSLVDTPMGGSSYEGTGGPGQLVILPMGGPSYKDTGGQVRLTCNLMCIVN